ncbi:hypothetical protein [Amycolatopsis sp. MtRt-6]|uniref:hypothetical protein n=1 Tax=Amycolatopsis sp. MtRt-6 TaxID=2792782 RepID=UPI001A8F81EE|nr:hypothetical protein [Amycolatopsis sp. MtRt-6]
MNGFEADPILLRAAGSRVRALTKESADRPALRYAARPELVGDVLLGAALKELQRASSAAAEVLLADADGLGERLELAAHRYADHQDDVRDRLDRIARGLRAAG